MLGIHCINIWRLWLCCFFFLFVASPLSFTFSAVEIVDDDNNNNNGGNDDLTKAFGKIMLFLWCSRPPRIVIGILCVSGFDIFSANSLSKQIPFL